MNAIKELSKNTVNYSGAYFKSINNGRYGNYQTAIKTFKVGGNFADIYNYVEENMHLWVGQVGGTQNTVGLSDEMIERIEAQLKQAQLGVVKKEIGKKFCRYSAAVNGDICRVTIIKGFLFFKSRVVIELNGYAGYCKHFADILKTDILKKAEAL